MKNIIIFVSVVKVTIFPYSFREVVAVSLLIG